MKALIIRASQNLKQIIECVDNITHCVWVPDIIRGAELIQLYKYDFIIIELTDKEVLNLEKILQIISKMRRLKQSHVIVILPPNSDHKTINEITVGGACCLTKPIEDAKVAELIATIIGDKIDIRTGRLTINQIKRIAEIDGETLMLSESEYKILELLSTRKGVPVTIEMLHNHLYRGINAPEVRVLHTFISNLRKKLRSATGGANYIVTTPGYVLRDPVPGEYVVPLAVAAE